MVETRRCGQRGEDVGQQQRPGLQAGLASEAGTSHPEGPSRQRLPGGPLRSALRRRSTVLVAEPCACSALLQSPAPAPHRPHPATEYAHTSYPVVQTNIMFPYMHVRQASTQCYIHGIWVSGVGAGRTNRNARGVTPAH